MPKTGIHPKYEDINVKCACGSVFQTRSTHKGDIVLEICAACHPFFTGKQKLIDTAGRRSTASAASSRNRTRPKQKPPRSKSQ